jgi:hypothetical protein
MQCSRTFRVVQLWLVTILVSIAAAACAPLNRSDAVPVDQEEQANIPGMTGIRYWADSDNTADMVRDAQDSLARERSYLASTGHQGPLPPPRHVAEVPSADMPIISAKCSS